MGCFYAEWKKDSQLSVDIISRGFQVTLAFEVRFEISIRPVVETGDLLLEKINSGDPDYHSNDKGSYIVLAHAYMIGIHTGLSTFEQYLKISPNDDLVDVEYLYSLIWAKDFVGARLA